MIVRNLPLVSGVLDDDLGLLVVDWGTSSACSECPSSSALGTDLARGIQEDSKSR